MKKAILLLPTILIGFAFQHLPTINTASQPLSGGGKIIKANPYKGGDYQIKTVVIDPGHGGHDPGCLGPGAREKNLALAIGKYFAQALKKNYPEINVIMTRSTDVFVTLEERAAIATRNKADLFVSIHCNFIPKANHIHGAETYVLGLHATKENLEVAKRENESILFEDNYKETYDGYDPNSPEAHIVLSMFQNAFLEQSILFAEKVQEHSVTEAGRKDRGVKQAGFLVLRHATMPSVLVETGYLSNAEELRYLKTEKGQKSIANALLLAFGDYKNEMETGSEAPRVLSLTKLDVDKKEQPEVAVRTKPEVTPPAVEKKKQPALTTTPTPSPAPMDAAPDRRISKNIKLEKPERGTKILAAVPVETTPAFGDSSKSQNVDVQFCVQLAASPKLLEVTKGRWRNVKYLIEVVKEDRLYKYQVRNFAALSEANVIKKELRAIGFNDAFVVAYKNGVKMNPRDVK
ncbi:MAG: N-acetylmuramoyl-L-alanine amidase [Saprospiraceae bacterium]